MQLLANLQRQRDRDVACSDISETAKDGEKADAIVKAAVAQLEQLDEVIRQHETGTNLTKQHVLGVVLSLTN